MLVCSLKRSLRKETALKLCMFTLCVVVSAAVPFNMRQGGEALVPVLRCFCRAVLLQSGG